MPRNLQIVRSNSNAIMFRNVRGSEITYSVWDVRNGFTRYSGTLDACRSGWNRTFRNSRQFGVRNGLNHRYMF